MSDETLDEVYERATDSLARLRKVENRTDYRTPTKDLIDDTKEDLEIIRRRTDPAARGSDDE